MKSNLEIQNEVQDELRYEPMLSGSNIVVSVDDRAICLTGSIDSFFKIQLAANVAKQIAEFNSIVCHIEVRNGTVSYFSESTVVSMGNLLKVSGA